MKVTGQNQNIAKELTTEQSRSKEVSNNKNTGADGPHGAMGTSSVKTSAFVLKKINERIAAEPEVRQDRVAELKAQIASGDYKIDAHGLAGKMLSESLLEDK
ncbi:MAG: flagellar biosynthesis anti-sigma factor FlgM [SAR324 cluster bacterium]|nr:flagellar biosynthesis anti-sigma factor FlgM [SAR324 cluster bacterium]